jgi:hypothetical protein
LLRRHPWNFAKRRASLPEVLPAPISEFYHNYQLPADFITLCRTDDRQLNYSIEGNLILTTGGHFSTASTNLNILYIAYVTDPNLFDPIFREVLSHWLASKLAINLRNNMELSKSLENEYKELIREAKHRNAIENPMIKIYDDEIPMARRKNIWTSTTPLDAGTM